MLKGDPVGCSSFQAPPAIPLTVVIEVAATQLVPSTNRFSVPAARTDVRRFLEAGNMQFVVIGEREFEIAAEAYAQYGKGRHPAALNMGDCFAYACARVNRAKLLFKGEDFTKADIPSAG